MQYVKWETVQSSDVVEDWILFNTVEYNRVLWLSSPALSLCAGLCSVYELPPDPVPHWAATAAMPGGRVESETTLTTHNQHSKPRRAGELQIPECGEVFARAQSSLGCGYHHRVKAMLEKGTFIN